jgi:hypothetical protein
MDGDRVVVRPDGAGRLVLAKGGGTVAATSSP